MVDFADRWDLQNRRALLKNILQGLTLGRAAPPEEPLRGQVAYANGDHLGLPGGFLAIEVYPENYWDPEVEEVPDYLTLMPGLGWAGARPAPRSEVIGADAGPDPEPLTTEIDGGKHPTIFRTWEPEAIQTCRRCHRCSAFATESRPGVVSCLLRYDGPLPPPEPAPEPQPVVHPTTSRYELNYQRRLAAISRRNALRDSRERRRARDLEPVGSGT